MTNEAVEDVRKNVMGVTDVPCHEEQQDKLDMVKYVIGLEKFIKTCPTPMSIAIQGDWGTGKTSTINMLQRRLEDADGIKCVYFNTWQYSQFSMEDDLYVSFVNTLVRKCCPENEKGKEILGIVQKAGAKLLFNTVKDKTGLDVEELIKKQEEKMESVEKLKSNFAEMIKEETGENGRIVVFIDDLDRLNPEVAVELLEVIKLFMDVEKCIFVLAIDYEVVVSGVKSKYGQNVSEEKCRNFFDKIIQLPFRLPVETYQLEALIEETVKDDIQANDVESLAGFVSELLGPNPRAYKRLSNSFFLIRSVNEELQKKSDPQLDNVLIFGSVCIQMCIPKLYQLLMSSNNEKSLKEISKIMTEENLDLFIENQKIDLEMDEKEKKNVLRCLISFNDFLDNIQKNHGNTKNFWRNLSEVLQMAAITSVTTSNEQKKRAEAIKVNKIILNGKEQSVSTPTEAIVETYHNLLRDDLELIRAYREEEDKMLTDKEEKKDAFFRNRRVLYEREGYKIYIGLSSSTSDKMKYTSKLCSFLTKRGKEAHVVWKYNEELIFDSDN